MKDTPLSYLQKVGIMELRVLARDIGVKSPTSQNKEDLIKNILAVIMGEVEPKSTNQGRPPKKLKEKSAQIFAALQELMANKEEVAEPTSRREMPRINSSDENVLKEDAVENTEQANEYIQKPIEQIEERVGILEIHVDGYGFIRTKNCEPNEKDAYIHNNLIRRLGLRRGDMIRGQVRRQVENRYLAMFNVIDVNGQPVDKLNRRPNFEDLTPIFPNQRLVLELPNSKLDAAIRSIDLVAPIGKGQRAMIVSPPKAGKTTLLKKIANSITKNHPECHLIVLLIDERPEEVTDMQRSINGEVIYSTFDETPEHHTRAAELVLARAKRLVEIGKDVVILLDSLTRLARAYNLTVPPTGRTLSGGIDPGALHSPKRFFGSARKIENGGSLTIIASALIDTGSRMDDVIFEEFKGTGNMELHLDRKLSEKRIFPAIDLARSGTRREDLLLSQKELEGIWTIRKILSVGDTQEATEQLISMMLRTNNNMEFIDNLQAWIKSLK